MKDEIKEIYLSNLEWTKTHDNIGGVMGYLIFKENMPYEEYEMLLKSGYFILCNKDYITNLQTIEQQYSAILSENAELENKITNLQEELEEQKRIEKESLNKILDLEDTIIDKQECIDVYDEIIKNRDKEIERLNKNINKTIHRIQLLQMDREVVIRDITELASILKGSDKE